MKTLLLRSSIILCLLFLGLKNAEANVSFTNLTSAGGNLPVNTIYGGQTAVAVSGLSIASSSRFDGTTTLNSIAFTTSVSAATLGSSYANIQLVSSADPYDPTPGNYTVSGITPTITTVGGVTTITFSNVNTTGAFSQTARQTTTYYYLIVDYTASVAGTVNFKTSAYNTTNGTTTATGYANNTFTLKAPTLTAAAITAGLSGTTLTASQNNVAVYGMSLKATGNASFSALNFGTTSAPAGNISPNYSSVSLYSSTSATFPGVGSATLLQTLTGIAATSANFTGLTETINDGVTKYYYLVVNYVEPAVNTTTNFNTPTVTGSTTTGTATGQTYNLKAPSLVVAPITAGLSTTTLTASQNNVAVYGMSLTATGNASFSALNFGTTSAPAGNISPNYSSVSLYSSTSASFPGVGSATLLQTLTGIAATSANFTGLTETINNGVTKYYYLVVNYVEPSVNTTINFNTPTVTGTATTGTATGQTYNLKAPSLAEAPITAGLAPTTLVLSQNNISVYGISLKATGNASFTALNFTTTSTPGVSINTYFPSVQLYSSSSATFDGTATAVSGATYSALTGTTLGITGLTETINDGVTKYYYLVVNYTEPTTTSGTFAFNTPTVTGAATTGAAAGQTYNLKAPSLAEAAITAGLAPTSLTLSQNNIAIFGMSLKATGNNTFSALNFTTTTAPVANIIAYFSSVQLYSSSNATFDGTATPVSGATYSALTANTLAVTGLSETINDGTTKYYYMVVNYVEPSTTGTFAFNSPTVTGTNTTGAAAGQTYTLNAATLAETAITAGLAPTTLTASQNSIGVFGMSLKATGNNSFSELDFTTTSTAPAGSNINTYFSSVQLYSSSSATFDGTATAVSGATYSALNATTFSVTGLTETINDGATKYYYLVVNYVEPATTGTFKFNSPTIVGASATGSAAGQVYTCTAPSLAETAITAGLAGTTLTSSQNNIGVFGMSLKATGDATFSSINFTTATTPTVNINAYFSSVQLYVSASATFDGTATAVSGGTYSTLAANNITVSGLSEAISNGTTKYYYLVVNYVEPPTTTGTIKFTAGTITSGATSVTTTGTGVGQTYTCTTASLTQAQVTAGLATSPLTVSQTGIAVYGMSLKAVGTASVTALKFTTTSTAPAGSNINTYFPSVQLYSSTSNTFNGTATPVSGAVYSTLAATTLNITSLSETINDGVTKYYYLVVNYTQPLTSATYQFSLNTVTGTPTTIGGAAGTNYTITAPSLTENQTTGGLYAPTTITNSQTNIPLSGISLVSANGNSTVTQINYTATQNISTYFSGNVNLYRSTSATFSLGTATLVTSTAVPNSPNISFALSGANQTITTTPVYYYLVMDANILPTTTTTFEWDVNTVTTPNTTTYTDKTGTLYTLTAPTITENQTAGAGLYTPTTITGNQTNLALSGISLVSVNGSIPVTAINYTATRNISTYFSGNVNLYKSTSATFSLGTATFVASTPAPNSTTVSFALTGANQTITSTPVYYYLVMDANIIPITTTTFEWDVNTVTSAYTVNYTDKTGTSYTLNAPALTENQVTGGLYTPTTISGNQSNLPLSGISLVSANGNSTVTAINYTATQNISTYFSGNVNFYKSTSATFSMGTATLITSTAVPNGTNITFNISGADQTITSTPVYYYLVMDANIPPSASTTFQWNVNTISTVNTTTYTDKTGTPYTLSPAVTLGTATATGLAANPLNYSQAGIGIYGFSITTTASETFNQFNFTATQTIGNYFSNVKLYSNTTNSFATATPVSGVTVSNLNSTTLTLSGLSQTVNPGTPMYYFIVVDFTDPSTATTFQLSVKNVITATTTYTNGTPVAGTIYNLGPVTYDWTGAATAVGGLYPWTTPGNWRVNGATATTYPGQNGATADIVNIGVNVTYTHQPNLAANVTIASMFFGYDGPQSTYQTSPGTLVQDNITLTVGTGSTLTVTGNITQNHNPSSAGSNFNFSVTTLAGLGTILCQGNLLVGDAVTQPGLTVAVVTEVSSQINQLTVNGNIILTTNGNAPQSVTGNRGVCYAYFSLDKGTTTLLKQIKFATNNSPISGLFNTYNPGITAYKGYGLFTCDKTPSSPNTLELQNVQPIVPADLFYVSFTFGGNNGTVLYDDPNATDNQVIYTNNEPSVTTTQTYINTTNPSYYNVSFAGPSTKLVDKNSTITTGGTTTQGFTLGGTWTTDGGVVDLKTNDPTVVIGGAWNNTTTVNHDAGTITVGGMFSNNVSGDASGILNCGTADITFKGGYTNNATFVANATGNINFSPTTAETITDNSTYGTTFNNVNFTSGTTTINAGLSTIGNIAVSNVGKLKMSGTGKLVAGTTTSGGTGYLTLMSNAASTATVYTPSGTSITGNVNVQRWITGGTGYRGYRLFSSPVNATLNSTGGGNLSLGYLGANGQFANNTYLGAFTEGPGTGFTYNGSFNPIIYLYDETRPSNNQGFTAGKNIGIYSITGNTVTTLTSGVQQAGVSIPVGNSYLLYYVGDNHLTDQTAVLTSRIPESTPVTATGYLNQGNVVVSFWKNNSTTIPYDVNGGNLPGLNQVGNPYASTIKLSQFYSDNSAIGISPQFWVLDATTGLSGTYISYNATSGATSSTKSGNYVVSGQGFLVQATAAGSANLTFKEDQKVDYPAITSTSGAPNGALVMDIPSNNPSLSKPDITGKSFAIINPEATGSVLTGLHLQLSKDSTYYTQTGIYFSTQWSDAYSVMEDAVDLDGATPKVFLSSYSSDGKRLSINELGDYAQGKRIKLYAGASSSGAYSISLADFMNIDTVNYKVYLIDKKMNDSLDLVHYKSYGFNINNSDTSTWGANRFVLAIEHTGVPQYLLTSFRGIKVKAGVQLIWTAMNASDYTGYILQKEDNKGNFNPLYTTQSVKGDNSYSYVDLNPVIGKNTYRLLQNDINGRITYSDTITIKYNHLAQGFAGLTVFPNPSNSIINVVYTNATSDNSIPNYTVDIFNSIGTFIKHESIRSNSWTEDISGYKLGVYVLQIKDNNGNLVGQTKFIRNL